MTRTVAVTSLNDEAGLRIYFKHYECWRDTIKYAILSSEAKPDETLCQKERRFHGREVGGIQDPPQT